MRFYIISILLIICNASFGQTYFNTVVETEYPKPLIKKIYPYDNNQYLIPYDFGPSDSTFTSFLITDFENSYELSYRDIDSGVNPLHQIGNSYYHVGEKAKSSEEVLICKKYSSDLEKVIWKKSYATKGVSTINAGFATINSNLFLLNVNRFSNDPLYWTLQIVKIDTSGKELWTKYYGEHAKYNYAWDLEPTKDDNLLLSQTISYPAVNSTSTRLLKLDPDGEIIWEAESKQKLIGGASPIHVTELSDSTIVQMYEVDMRWMPDFDVSLWNYTPTRLKWFDKNGTPIKEQLLKVPKKDILRLYQLETGRGDYFFTYGSVEINTEKLYDYRHGIIMKFDKNGDTLWVHQYKHPDYVDENASHTIQDILELENGDILALGRISGFDYTKMWVMRLDEQGCFGEGPCDDSITPIDTMKIDSIPHGDMVLYPNPTTGLIYLDDIWISQIEEINVFNCLGKKVFGKKNSTNNEIDLSNSPTGIYFLRIKLIDKKIYTERIVRI